MAAAYAGEIGTVPSIAARATVVPADDTVVARFLGEFLQGVGSYFSGAFETAAPSHRAALELADEADLGGSTALRALLIFAGGAGLYLGDDQSANRLHGKLVVRSRETGMLTLLTQTLPRLAMSQIGAGQ